jgi:TrmH family RNA methyltransferase
MKDVDAALMLQLAYTYERWYNKAPDSPYESCAMNAPNQIDNIVVVLYRPQKLVNIAGAIRAMKNMGLQRLRLVRPSEYAPADIEGIAHRSADVLAATTLHSSLDDALSDAVYVAGTTARTRELAPQPLTPRQAAPALLARAAQGTVALLFGPEDNGLRAEELDRCHCVLRIPTDPHYRSLNLAQAVLIVAYELWQAHEQPAPAAIRSTQPANAAQLEGLFDAAERALWGIEFFKSGSSAAIMRSLRSLIHRADLDAREAALLRAMALETLEFLRRRGMEPRTLPPDTGHDPHKSS